MKWNEEQDPIGINEIGSILNVSSGLVSTWKSRNLLPKADKYINAGRTPIWMKSTITNWADATGKNKYNLILDNAEESDLNSVNEDIFKSLESIVIDDLEWEG